MMILLLLQALGLEDLHIPTFWPLLYALVGGFGPLFYLLLGLQVEDPRKPKPTRSWYGLVSVTMSSCEKHMSYVQSKFMASRAI